MLNMLVPGSLPDKAAEAAQAVSASASLSSGPSLRTPSVADRSVRASGCNAVVGGVAFLRQDNEQHTGRPGQDSTQCANRFSTFFAAEAIMNKGLKTVGLAVKPCGSAA